MFKLIPAILSLTLAAPAFAELEVPKHLHRNWSIDKATMTIAKGSACNSIRNGKSTTTTRAQIADFLMDSPLVGRYGANRAAAKIVSQSLDCAKSATLSSN